MTASEPRARWQLTAGMLVAVLAAFKLLLHLYAGRYYGYFVDELYNLALARHLAWGYVDVAPMIALLGRIGIALFGSSLSAIRLAPALAGAALVLLTGAMARELGGRRFAQGLAALSVLLAPGILALDHFLNVNAVEPLCWMGCALLVLMGALLAPTMLPVLPPETYIRYAAATHLAQPRAENFQLGPLPQLFADQFGWEEMAAAVAGVYHSLPADIRPRTAIFGQNYGQAGAIDLFGPRYGLPAALSGHQNYFLWGPRGATGESMIVMGGLQQRLESQLDSVRKVAHVGHPYAMPYEHIDIFYCRGIKQPLAEFWPKVKNWH